jgi:hypothetical protein
MKILPLFHVGWEDQITVVSMILAFALALGDRAFVIGVNPGLDKLYCILRSIDDLPVINLCLFSYGPVESPDPSSQLKSRRREHDQEKINTVWMIFFQTKSNTRIEGEVEYHIYGTSRWGSYIHQGYQESKPPIH